MTKPSLDEDIYSVKEKNEKTEREKETEVYYLINRIIQRVIIGVWARKTEANKHKYDSGEFDPGSGWTLAIGLTHASRGAAWS